MKKKSVTKAIAFQNLESKIYSLRGHRVMFDSDLAEIYGVSTTRLNEQVKRNIERFPEDFMFQLTKQEFENLISHFAISSWGGRRTLPYVFTEHGALMLASVLTSPVAIQGSISVVRAFLYLRQLHESNKELSAKLNELENKVDVNKIDIKTLFEAIRRLMNPPVKERKRIGFKE